MNDLLLKNVRVVRPDGDGTPAMDVAIRDGKFVAVAPRIDEPARSVVDGGGRLAFPGLVDAHMHVGIYHPLEEDARTESAAAAMGGVTSALTYFRTGRCYLDKGGPYAAFFPEVLERSRGNYHVDYGYHLAPIHRQHIGEIELLAREHGVTSFKIFMFYGSHGLHGRAAHPNDFLLLGDDERYDTAHFEFIMRELSRLRRQDPALGGKLSLSLHCELGEILAAYTKIVEGDASLSGLRAYSASRPPHSEGLAIFIAAYLAAETECLDINLLHLSSGKAIEAALTMQRVFPHVRFRREVTIGHLMLDVDSPAGLLAKVNPPIRPREDVERLWQAVVDGDVDWVVSDHACCTSDEKIAASRPRDVFAARSGFGGTEWLLSALFSEGTRRGLSPNRIAALTSTNPARRFGLAQKGDVAPGLDADLVLFDPDARFVVRAAESPSGQGYTPFEGLELGGRVVSTYLRGRRIYHEGRLEGEPGGRYLKR